MSGPDASPAIPLQPQPGDSDRSARDGMCAGSSRLELRGQMLDHYPRHVARAIREEPADVAHGAHLEGELEPTVIIAPLRDQLAVLAVEEEEPDRRQADHLHRRRRRSPDRPAPDDRRPADGVEIAIAKAFTAAGHQRATHLFNEEPKGPALPGNEAFGIQHMHPGRFAAFVGGFPVVYEGQVIGAVGVSGGNGEQDKTVGAAALAAFERKIAAQSA